MITSRREESASVVPDFQGNGEVRGRGHPRDMSDRP